MFVKAAQSHLEILLMTVTARKAKTVLTTDMPTGPRAHADSQPTISVSISGPYLRRRTFCFISRGLDSGCGLRSGMHGVRGITPLAYPHVGGPTPG